MTDNPIASAKDAYSTFGCRHSFGFGYLRLRPAGYAAHVVIRHSNGQNPNRLDPAVPRTKGAAIHSPSGFTLLEILLALAIMATVLSILYGGHNVVVGHGAALKADMAQVDMTGTCLNRLTADLAAIHLTLPPEYRPPEFDAEPDPYRITGRRDSVNGREMSELRFASRAHLSLAVPPVSGIGLITYHVTAEEDGGFTLRRADRLHPFGEEREPSADDPVVCDNLQAFTVAFIDAEGDRREEWDSESDDVDFATPRVVAVTLEVGDAERSSVYRTAVRLPLHREARE